MSKNHSQQTNPNRALSRGPRMNGQFSGVKEKPKDTMRELAESYYKFYKTLIKSGFTSEQAFELLKMYVRS